MIPACKIQYIQFRIQSTECREKKQTNLVYTEMGSELVIIAQLRDLENLIGSSMKTPTQS